MPIISISINEHLKKFINKLVSRNQYENKSKLIRDALLQLMSTMDVSNVEAIQEIVETPKKIVGNMMIVAPNDSTIVKKLNKIENEYKNQIISKNQHFYYNSIMIFVVFEGSLQDFQKVVVEINGVKEIKNFRYLIVN